MSVQVAVVGDELISPLLPLGFPNGSVAKESTCKGGDLRSTPGLRSSLGRGNGYPLQYFGPENSKVGGKESDMADMSDFQFHFHCCH